MCNHRSYLSHTSCPFCPCLYLFMSAGVGEMHFSIIVKYFASGIKSNLLVKPRASFSFSDIISYDKKKKRSAHMFLMSHAVVGCVSCSAPSPSPQPVCPAGWRWLLGNATPGVRVDTVRSRWVCGRVSVQRHLGYKQGGGHSLRVTAH